MIALPRVTGAGRATVTSRCGSREGLIHDGDDIALGARGHLRLHASLEGGAALDVTCVSSSTPLSLTVRGAEAPWLTAGDAVNCGDWAQNERVCRAASTGDEVLVCDATARAAPRTDEPAARPLGVPAWYVGDVVPLTDMEIAAPPPTATASLVSPAPPTRAGKHTLRLAVADLTGNLDKRMDDVLSESLVAELRKLDRVSVMGMAEVRAMLAAQADRSLAGCESESCLSEIASALGAEVLIVGAVAELGDEHFLSLKRIDQESAKVAGSVTRRVKAVGNGEDLLSIVGDTVAELFPDHELRAGKTRGVSKELVARLNPPPLQPWMIFAAGGVTAALGATSSVALGASVATLSAFQTSAAKEGVIEGAELRALEDNGKRADAVAAVAGVACVVLAGVTVAAGVWLTDWYAFGESEVAP